MTMYQNKITMQRPEPSWPVARKSPCRSGTGPIRGTPPATVASMYEFQVHNPYDQDLQLDHEMCEGHLISM